MSNTIDSKVVEMRFDNKHFEKNVQTSLSTLEKLKQKLKFKDAGKSLEGLQKSINKVDMTTLGNSVEKVGLKFDAMYTVADQALRNITNSAMRAGEQIVKSLTIDPVKTGYNEYLTQLNSTQSILSNVKFKGKDIHDVNAALDELNTYADQTIYNFTEMTRNIGYFVNAGVDLDESVASIKGFSNAAAVSGADATRTAQAMYQLSQAMSTGVVKLMDWRSLTTANIGGEMFQNSLKETARVHGIAIDKIIAEEGSFNESLKENWLTSEIMNETLEKYTATTKGLTDAEIELLRAKWKSRGYTEEQIDGIIKLGNEATSAATEVKSASQMFDILKETAQTGWSTTWELIFGDLEQAKAIFTPLTNFLQGFIDRMSEARNKLIEGALSSPIGQLAQKIASVTAPVTEATDKMKDFADVVNSVLSGNYGNGETRFSKLTEEGYNWMHIQNLVNEKLGDSHRYAVEYAEGTDEVTQAVLELSDAQLEEIGLTDKEIEMYRDLEKQAKKSGKSVNELIAEMDQMDGRTMLIESFKNVGGSLDKILQSIGEAWRDAFPPMTSEQLYNIISAIHSFSQKLAIGDDTIDKLTRTLKGLFAALDIVLTVIGAPIKVALKIIGALLGGMNLDILTITAAIGDYIVAIRKFLFENNIIIKTFEKLGSVLADIIGKFVGVGTDIINGLINGLTNGTTSVIDAIINIAKGILDTICNFLGIRSPSTKMIEVGKNIIDGLVKGLVNGIRVVGDALKKVGSTVIEFFRNIDWGKIIGIGAMIGSIFVIKKIADALGTLAAPFDAISSIGDGVENVLKGAGSALKGFGAKLKAQALKDLAIALGILVVALWGVTKIIEQGNVWEAVGVIGALAGILAVLAISIDKFTSGGTVNVLALSALMISLGVSMALMGKVIKDMAGLSDEGIGRGIFVVGGLIVLMKIFAQAVSASGGVVKAAGTLLAMSVSIGILVGLMVLIGFLKPETIENGIVVIGALMTFLGMFIVGISKYGGQVVKVGGTLLGISVAIGILVGTMALIGLLSEDTIKKGAVVIGGLMVFLYMFIASLGKLGPNIVKVGGTLFALSAAIAILVAVMALIGLMELGTLLKGGAVVAALMIFLKMFINGISKCGPDVPKVAATLLALSVSIGVLALVMTMLGVLSIGHLAKGFAVVAGLGILLKSMIKATASAKDCKGNLIVMTVAIGIMAAAVAALSFIPFERLAPAAVALALLMGMFALMAKMSSHAKGAMGSLIVMTVAVALLAGLIYQLAQLPIESALAASGALSVLLLSISVSMAIINTFGKVTVGAVASLAVMTVIVYALGEILRGLMDLDLNQALSTTVALSTLLISMSAVCGLLTLVGLGGPAALIGIGSLITLLVAMGGVFVAVGALVQKFPAIETFVDTGIPLMEKLSNGIGSMLGNFVAGFAEGVTDGLPDIGTNLGLFMANAMPFIAGAKLIDDNVTSGVKNLASTILMLTGANLLESISSFISGESSLDGFGTQLKSLASGLNDFITELGPIDESTATSVTCASNALKALAEAANTFPNSGGWLGTIMGENDADSFGDKLGKLGSGISDFVSNVGTFTEENKTSAANAANAIAEIAKAAGKIPNEGGWISKLVGDNNIATFGEKLPGLGKAIKDFTTNVNGAKEAAANTAVKVLNALTKLSNIDFDASNDGIEDLSDILPDLASAVKSFSNTIGKIKAETLTASINKLKSVIASIKSIATEDISGLKTLANSLKTLGQNGVKALAESFSGDANTATISTAVKSLVTTAVDAVKNNTNVTAFTEAGKTLVTKFSDGITDNSSDATDAAKTLGDDTADSVGTKSQYTDMYDAGKYLVKGFAKGISDNDYLATAKAKAMAKKAKDAAKKELDENSPSKEFWEIGKFVAMGLANGIDKNTKLSTNASKGMADGVLTSFQKELKINSPSLVMNEQGQWIVKGVEEGIKECKTAEEAAKKKAQNIMDAFQKEIDKHQIKIDLAQGRFDLTGDISYLNTILAEKANVEDLALDKWNEMKRYFGAGSQEANEAERDYVQSQLSTIEQKAQNVNDTFDKRIEQYDTLRDITKNELELWKETEGKHASHAETDAKDIEYLTNELAYATEQRTLAYDKYLKLVDEFGETDQRSKTAWNDWYSRSREVAQLQNSITDVYSNAFDREIQRMNDSVEYRTRVQDLWFQKSGKKASIDEQYDRMLSDTKANIETYTKVVEEANKAHEDAIKNNAADNDAVTDAYRRALEAEETLVAEQAKIYEILQNGIEARKNLIDQQTSLRDAETNLWLKTDGKKATDAEKTQKLIGDAQYRITQEQKKLAEDQEAYRLAVEEYGEESTQALAALETVKETEIRIVDEQQAILDYQREALEKKISVIDQAISIRNKENDLWDLNDGNNRSEADKAVKDTARLNENLRDLRENVETERQLWKDAISEFGKNSTEAKEAYSSYLDAQIEVAQTQQALIDLTKAAIEREKETYDLLSETAELRYNIWEKTDGYKATSMEKDIAKLGMLSEQMAAESKTLELVRGEWIDAKRTYGETANETQEAYNKYLQKQLDLAELQNSITDLNEKSIERQKLAQSEYKSYMKKYKKFYLENGMTLEDLESDAKLVSGWDPNGTVTNMIDRTASALEDVKSSTDYANLITEFSSLGVSYMGAVDEGVASQSSVILQTMANTVDQCLVTLSSYEDDFEDTVATTIESCITVVEGYETNLKTSVSTIVTACIDTVRSYNVEWNNVGFDAMAGFAAGIRSGELVVIRAAQITANLAIRAAKATLNEHSPSKVFYGIGEFAVMGLANGFTENAKMAADAASEIAESSIQSFRDTIARISEMVESDIDSNPVIRPVIDLTDVEAGAARINAMFSASQARKIVAMNNDQTKVNQNGDVGNVDNSKSFNFVQNNYSPKALSRTEIYRQTKNQFAAMKGAMT